MRDHQNGEDEGRGGRNNYRDIRDTDTMQLIRKVEKLIYLWRRVNADRDKDVKLLTELRGVMLRLGYINSGGNECGYDVPQLDQPIAWELGIDPDSTTAELISLIRDYLEKRKCS